MPYITVGQENSGPIELYYEDHGNGQPVVLIHGWPLSGASWERQTPVLVRAGYRVIMYDRRGFGKSSQPTTGYDYDTLATDLHTLIQNLDLRDIALFGFSMGGGEVARYFKKFKGAHVKKAGFLSAIPPFLRKTNDNPEGVDQALFDGIQQGIAADRPAFLAQFLNNFFNVDVLKGSRISDQAVQMCWNVAAGASYQGTFDCVQAWLEDFREDLAQVSVPTLVIHGDADRILPIEVTGARTHQLVHESQLVTVQGGPHGLTWTHADVVNPALLEFLKA